MTEDTLANPTPEDAPFLAGSKADVLDAHNVLSARLAQAIGIVAVMRREAVNHEGGDEAEALWGLETLLDQALDAYNVIEATNRKEAAHA